MPFGFWGFSPGLWVKVEATWEGAFLGQLSPRRVLAFSLLRHCLPTLLLRPYLY